jgi:hypothetical protein
VAKIENFWGECHYVLKKLTVMQMFNEAPGLYGAKIHKNAPVDYIISNLNPAHN